jgi:hypothetical protein
MLWLVDAARASLAQYQRQLSQDSHALTLLLGAHSSISFLNPFPKPRHPRSPDALILHGSESVRCSMLTPLRPGDCCISFCSKTGIGSCPRATWTPTGATDNSTPHAVDATASYCVEDDAATDAPETVNRIRPLSTTESCVKTLHSRT